MTQPSKPRKPKFRVGQVVRCRACGVYDVLLSKQVLGDGRDDLWNSDIWADPCDGKHSESSLRPLTRKEIGPAPRRAQAVHLNTQTLVYGTPQGAPRRAQKRGRDVPRD